jgi:hypothetical protein
MENWRKFVKEATDQDGDGVVVPDWAKKPGVKPPKWADQDDKDPSVGDALEEDQEGLVGGQKKLDKNKDGKISGADFKLMDENDDLGEGKGGQCPKCKQVVEGPMEEHQCGGEAKKESAFSGNGALGEPIEEKKRKKRKRKSSRCTKVTKKTSSTRKGKKWMKCVKSDSGGYKRIHWGQAGVRVTGKSGNTKRKKSFKARHGCSTAKSNTPKGQACKDWA